MAGSRPGKLAVGEEWLGLGERHLALRELQLAVGSCPACNEALGWI